MKEKISFKELTDNVKSKTVVKEKENKDIINKEISEDKKTENKNNTNKSVASLIEVSASGEMITKTLEEKKVMAYAYLSSGMLPKQYDTIEKVITGMQFVSELGLKSLTALRQTYIVNGIPSLWGDLPLALVRKSGQLESFEEFLFDNEFKKICFENKNIDINVYGALCRVKRKGDSIVEKTFTIKDAINAKLITLDAKGIIVANPQKDSWTKYPKVMLMYKARAAALKVAFADILNGVGILEYDNDMIGDKTQIVDLDEEKELLIEEVNMMLSECRKIPEFNLAKENNIINTFIVNQDLRFGDKDSLKKLIEALRIYYKDNLPPA